MVRLETLRKKYGEDFFVECRTYAEKLVKSGIKLEDMCWEIDKYLKELTEQEKIREVHKFPVYVYMRQLIDKR